jgi:nucleoid-associated protein EbfC
MRCSNHYKHINAAIIYLLLSALSLVCSAFVHPTVSRADLTTSSTISSTRLHLLSWFSNMPWASNDSSNNNNNNNNKGSSNSEDDIWGTSNDKKNLSNGDNKSGLGGVAGIMDSMENFKTAQQVGKMTHSLVYELASTTVEGTAVDGKVKVIFDGQQRPLNVQIDEAYLEQADSSDLSAALTTAMKDAYRKSSERMDEKMKSFYVDLGLK